MAYPMKYRMILVLVFGLILSAPGRSEALTGRVVSIADGDTLTVLDDSLVQHKIRLAGIDAPEKRQSFGQRAKQSLAMLCFQQTVNVVFNKRDRYGRIVGQVLLDGQNVNLAQLQAGMAWVYMQYLHDLEPGTQTVFIEAEQQARAAKIGLWRESEPVPPWVFRRRTK